MTMAMRMPDGTVKQQFVLVPFYGPIPAQTKVVTSLQQLQQFRHQAGPTLIPSPQPQANSLHIVSPPVQIETTQRTADSSGTMNMVDANGVTNENKESGESSAKSPSNPSAAIVEDCSKTPVSRVDHETVEKTHVISNVPEVHVENNESVAVPQIPDVTQTKELSPPATASTFPTLSGPILSRENSESPGEEELIREESLHTSSDSGESHQSDFSKECTKAYVYKTMKKVRVRADKTATSDEVGILEKGKYVHIVFVEGKKGRIVEPLNGWVSLRKKKVTQVSQIFNNFGAPSVILRNLHSSLQKEKDILNFLRSQNIRPTRCIWQKKDDFVTVFFTKHKDASKLVRGKYVCNDIKLTAEWSDSYAKMVEL